MSVSLAKPARPDHISDRTRTAVALWHARAECRTEWRDEKQHHRDLMVGLIEGARNPQVVLDEIYRRLGRVRALEIALDPADVNRAIRAPKVFEGRL